MRVVPKMLVIATASLMSPLLATSAHAAFRTMTATIVVLSAQSTNISIAGVVDIVLSAPLQATGCPAGTRGFEFDSTSVPDAQTRQNMYSILLGAKLTGQAVTIVYDDGAVACSTHGFAVPTGISM